MIPQHFIEEVQQRTDIVELISSYIPLKKAGRNFRANCPFHSEKTPSFFVSPQKQIYHCFGCGEGGSSLQFIMQFEKISFVEAVEMLAKRLGMSIPYQKAGGQEKLRSSLYDAVYDASVFFYNNLVAFKGVRSPLVYLKSRGISKETIEAFRIGFAPGRNTLLAYMRQKGYTLDILEKASLTTTKRDGGYMDLFRDRIMFPIFDVRNKVVGFGARTLSQGEGIPKYINSPENALYSKRNHLFGLNFSKDDVIKNDAVIVCEGYLDMIVPYASGIRNIVASLGTALTQEQIRLIKRYTKNIILVFDSDKAGQQATLRAVDLLLESGLNVKVLTLPSGFDPDLLIRKKGNSAFIALLEKRVDFFEYKLGVLERMFDRQSIEGKTKIAKELLLTISKLQSEVQKHEYIKVLSSEIRVREEVLLAEYRNLTNQTRRSTGAFVRKPAAIPLTEKLIFKFIFSHPTVMAALKKKLREDDFSHPLTKKTYSFIVHKFSANDCSNMGKFMSGIPDKDISGFVSSVIMEDVGVLDKGMLKDCIGRLRLNRTRLAKDKLREQIRLAERNNDARRLKDLMSQYNKINSEVRNG